MTAYLIRYHDKLIKALVEHIQMVIVALFLSLVLAFAITLLVMDHERLQAAVMHVCSVIYSIPSLALFAVLIPLTGLGSQTAIVVLVVYNQYILVRSFLAGLGLVDAAVTEAAVGMGMDKWTLFRHIKFPLALDSIVAGIRIAVISTIGIATIGATIGAGGLGTILFDGMRTQNAVKILWGTILSVALVFITSRGLNYAEKKVRGRIYHGGIK